jgi:hypothetical protein
VYKVTSSTLVNLDLDSTWQCLSDLSKAHFYVPDISRTEITTEQQEGVGTSRRVYGKRPPIIETVTAWQQGKGFTLRLHNDKGDGVPPLFSQANFHYAINRESEQQTRLTNTIEFEMKFGFLGSLLIKLIRSEIQKMQDQITVGQKLYYESGEKAQRQDVIHLLKAQ